MKEAEKYNIERADPRAMEGFIARALERDGLKGGIREAALAFKDFSDTDITKAVDDMNPKVRNAVLKMVKARGKE